jgi:hypothetical protein
MPKIEDFIKNNPVADKAPTVTPKAPVASTSIKEMCMTNVVSDETLKKVQQETLRKLKNFLSKTYGPMDSYTKIISGTNKDTIAADYSKDGLKVLKNILFDQPIEMTIQSELREVCGYVDHKVGDGTTSAVILSSLIYDQLLNIMEKRHTLPRLVVRAFDNVLAKMKDVIESKANPLTTDDIYDICMVSTNGNEEVSTQISNLYKEFGMDLDIELDISNDQYTKVTDYHGLVINEGYSSPAAVNNKEKGIVEVHDAHVYYFKDPIDTPELLSYLARIIEDNILIPHEEGDDTVPTVIIAPMIGRDSTGILTKLDQMLYRYNSANDFMHKPQILICTNLAGTDEVIANDIQQICKCKAIGKFITFEAQDDARKRGEAVYIDKETGETNIHEFCGRAELVSADPEKTIFVNPAGMMNGESINLDIISYLEAEIKKLEAINDEKVKIRMKKNELRALRGNMITYYVGGISVADRNALKDLVEDAVKNCRSASINGWGRAANFEGFEASYELMVNNEYAEGSLESDVLEGIFQSYLNATKILYSTILLEDDAMKAVIDSINIEHAPYNVASLYNGEWVTTPRVITSICTDIEILNAISKIVTPMVTSNQCLLQATALNKY